MELFGSSGYRAIVDPRFMDVAFRFGFAMASMADSALIAVDTRTSSDAVKHCVVSGLLASGCKTYDAGTVPTPTLAYGARQFGVGIMITASHNPPEYNGIKPWNPDGSAFNARQRRHIERLVSRDISRMASWENIETMRPYPGLVDAHIDRILKDFPDKYSLKVVIDCGGGAGSFITPRLLGRMGCQVIAINSFPTGFFPRGTEPTAQSLSDLSQAVPGMNADLGLAHDADADRLVAVDELGRFVPGDKLMALLAGEIGAKSVVTTIDASMAIEDLGYHVTRTSVGDAYVSEQLKKGGDFGGEPAGAWIFPNVSYCPDGIYAAALATKMAAKGKLSQQVDSIPSYPIRRGSIKASKSLMESAMKGLLTLSPISTAKGDGVRMAFTDGWLLVRPSGTEPKVRVTAEARTQERVNVLYESAIRIIQDLSAEKQSSIASGALTQ